MLSIDLGESSHPGFTYVQGMNVLAAPFLYTMPSELEAFYCFSTFIEVTCPAYVQPTLEGVHRGLKVRIPCSAEPCEPELSVAMNSCWIGVSKLLIQSFSRTCGQKTFLPRSMRSPVRYSR